MSDTSQMVPTAKCVRPIAKPVQMQAHVAFVRTDITKAGGIALPVAPTVSIAHPQQFVLNATQSST